MSSTVRCSCQSCAIRGLTGPALVITVGLLFLLHEVRGGSVSFENTWPILLVVVGVIHLASSLASREGHIETPAPGAVPPPPMVPPAPPMAPPTATLPPQGQ